MMDSRDKEATVGKKRGYNQMFQRNVTGGNQRGGTMNTSCRQENEETGQEK